MNPTATIDGVAAVKIVRVDDTTLAVTTAQFMRTNERADVMIYDAGAPIAQASIAVRDEFLKILLAATERAWSPEPSSVGYRVLAAIAAGRERRNELNRRCHDQICPESADAIEGLPDFERDLALAAREDLSAAQRRARVRAKLNESPSLAWGAVLDALAPFLVGCAGADLPVIHELENYDVYGDLIWFFWVEITDAIINGPAWDWSSAEQAIRDVKPGFAGFCLGRRGFFAGISGAGRDAVAYV
jgi:hypothetical protein